MKNLIRGTVLLTAGALLLHFWAGENSPAVASAKAPAAQATRPVSTISYNGQEFLSTFNLAREETRLVLVFSPT
jgi:hypothetical protein